LARTLVILVWIAVGTGLGCAGHRAPRETPGEIRSPTQPVARADEPAEAAEPAGESPGSVAQGEASPTPEVSVDLTAEERERLNAESAQDIASARQIIETIDRQRLSADELDKLRIVEGMIHSADEAHRTEDLQAAAGLARKARLLAEELIKS
jgi:hypothetical protein